MFLIQNIVVRKTRGKGRGVFTAAEIAPGTVIGDYIGTVIKPGDEDEKKYGLYTMYVTERIAVQADPKTFGIHLINHSCEANCAMYPWSGRVLFFALRRIFAGEELSIDYCIDPPDRSCSPCSHECVCGAESCRGTMHVSRCRSEAYVAYLRKRSAGSKKKPDEKYGEIRKPLTRYPRSIPDQKIYDIFGSKKQQSLKAPVQISIRRTREIIRNQGKTIVMPERGIKIAGVRGNRLIVSPIKTRH